MTTPTSPTRKAPLAVFMAVAAIALSGCSNNAPIVAETPPATATDASTPWGQPSAAQPVASPSTDSEPVGKLPTDAPAAIKAGTQAYTDYLAVFAQILTDGGANPERIFDVASAAGGQVMESAAGTRKMAHTTTGNFRFEVLRADVSAGSNAEGKDLAPHTQTVLQVCIDGNELRDFSSDGQPVPRKGPQRIQKTVTTQWAPEQQRWIVVFDVLPDGQVIPC